MFKGIIEATTALISKKKEGTNVNFTFNTPFEDTLKIDQSLAHNGVCLTVVAIDENNYTVTAIEETLKKTNLGQLKEGDVVNLERCLKVGDRLDGHMVQGHVDTIAKCISKVEKEGSWEFRFKHPNAPGFITVEKGSICVNGISLTVFDSTIDAFSVAVIPYTFHHTNLSKVEVGDVVNIEFDILGKYLLKMQSK